jgi:phospholipase/carboxylesterase
MSREMDAEPSGATRIDARPGTATQRSDARGLQKLRDGARGGVFYVPPAIDATKAVPLIVMLHGAGGQGERALGWLRTFADAKRFIVVAPDSVGATWDLIQQRPGPDVERLDESLAMLFARFTIDASRVAIAGFSDGASYALSLGIDNGDLFTHVIAYSPGFMIVNEQVGVPRIYVSHGTADEVLPIAHCSRRLVPQLKGAGYDVTYREFAGGHTVPEANATESMEWLAGDR